MTEGYAFAMVIVACFIGAFGAICLKKASATLSFNPLKAIKNTYMILGFFLYGISTVLFIIALKAGELSVLYPFVATVYVWTALLSMKFLGEKMNKLKWIGILLIMLGVSFIGLGS